MNYRCRIVVVDEGGKCREVEMEFDAATMVTPAKVQAQIRSWL